jgi:hypothetical protein
MGSVFEHKVARFMKELNVLKSNQLLMKAICGLSKEYPRNFINFLNFTLGGFLYEIDKKRSLYFLESILRAMKERPVRLTEDELLIRERVKNSLAPLLRKYKKILRPAKTTVNKKHNLSKSEFNQMGSDMIRCHFYIWEESYFSENRLTPFFDKEMDQESVRVFLDRAKEGYLNFFNQFK